MKPYGCSNHPPRTQGQPVFHSKGNVSWPWRFIESPQCHYDKKQTDERCSDCRWVADNG